MGGIMAEASRAGAIGPKDVFQRSNMPSRWERIAGVSPKIDADRKFLVFVAARYRGDPRLPRPGDVIAPVALLIRSVAVFLTVLSTVLLAVGLSGTPAMAVVGGVLMACALATLLIVNVSAGEEIRHYRDIRVRSLETESRLRSSQLSSSDADTLNEMLRCDEGTLSYCAAKIASEIERDPAWDRQSPGFVQIDLWDELAEVGASARRIALDREATEQLERGRLRGDSDIRAVISESKESRREALAALAARIHGFADYRDRIQRLSALEVRDRGSLDRAVRLVSDEQARERLT